MIKLRNRKLLAIIVSVSLLLNGNLAMNTMAMDELSNSSALSKSLSGVEKANINSDGMIEISTEQDLKNIVNNLNGNYVLKNDIVLSGEEWTSITGVSDYFNGSLDGAGHTISNLYSSDGQSLFLY